MASSPTRPKVVDAQLNISIPNSLRAVAPFLDEAQSIIRLRGDSAEALKIALLCMDHAFTIVDKYEFPLDEAARSTLREFEARRAETVETLERFGVKTPPPSFPRVDEPKPASPKSRRAAPEEVLVAEASATLELAEEQLKSDMKESAAKNFHTATIYFRVLQSILPLNTELQAKLEYASARTLECSHLLQNFVREHFTGAKCSDVYDIMEKKRLGQGSYGSVHLCTHRKTGDKFACKMISMSRISSHYLRKLHLEIAIMKEVDHPNIVKLKEVFFGSRTVYLVMELCEGGELFDQITGAGKKGFAEPYCARLVHEMLSAIKYLHERGIVHRDIKLENYLFESTAPDAPLKLIDFGLSKHYDERESMRQVVGSAYYTAPEVLNGGYDQRCDLWSIGVIAYMLLCGSPPFYGETSHDIHRMALSEEPDYEGKLHGASPAAVEFVRGLLTKDPDRRITIEDALRHDFLRQMQPSVNDIVRQPSAETVQTLAKFLGMSKARKMLLKAVAFSLNTSQISQLREGFHAIDADHNGLISMEELKQSMQATGVYNKVRLEEIFQSGAVDRDAQLNYTEFCAAAMLRRLTIDEERLKLAFQNLDRQGTGYLTPESIRAVLGQEEEDQTIVDVLNELDFNKDGKIDYKEFLVYWKGVEIEQKVTPMERMVKGVSKVATQISVVKAFMGFSSRSKMSQVVELHRRKTQEKAMESIANDVAGTMSASEINNGNRAVSGKYFPKLFKNDNGIEVCTSSDRSIYNMVI